MPQELFAVTRRFISLTLNRNLGSLTVKKSYFSSLFTDRSNLDFHLYLGFIYTAKSYNYVALMKNIKFC